MTIKRSRQRIGSGLAGLLLVAVLCFGPPSAGAAASTVTKTFTFTGGEQIFTVPDGVTSLDVVAVGGKGGTGVPSAAGAVGGPGGFGAAATAKLTVTPGQALFIEVGGNGGEGGSAFDAGFNGGGRGSDAISGYYDGGGGGGGTDIRTISRAAAGDTLGSRLIIAGGGGGGGAGGDSGTPGGFGGSAGAVASGDGSRGGGVGGATAYGGTQTDGGYGVFQSGSLGQGGDADPGDLDGGGGGGGGKFGGGGGDSSTRFGGTGGGGGSTGFAPTATNTSFQTDATGVPLIRLSYSPSSGGAGNPGAAGAPPGGTARAAALTLVRASARVGRNLLTFGLRCNQATPCVGAVVVQNRTARGANAAALLTIAKGRFKVAPGKSKTVRARFTRKGKQYIRTHRRALRRAKVYANLRMGKQRIAAGRLKLRR